LTTTQIASLETTDLQALKTTQIAALTTTQINSGLTTTQIAALTTTQLESWSTTQIQALTTTQIQSLASLSTPIILDLSGDGIQTLDIASGVQFDINATGQRINTGWVGQGNGLLVLDRNKDGQINDGSELFGSATNLSSGHTATNGYEALKALDTNGDGFISSSDNDFDQLRVWVDGNADGVSQSVELRSLDSLGISSLDTNASTVFEKNNGNYVGLSSGYTTTDGQNHKMADVWFVTDQSSAIPSPLKTEPSHSSEEKDLRTQVNSLVKAISSFDDSQFDSVIKSESLISTFLPTTIQDANVAMPLVSNIAGLVDTMKQFDASGNLITGSAQTSNSLQTSVGSQSSVTDALDPTKNGFLAS